MKSNFIKFRLITLSKRLFKITPECKNLLIAIHTSIKHDEDFYFQ